MEIKQVELDQLKPASRFILSYPLQPDLYQELSQKLSPLPLMIVNRSNEIIFGSDYYEFLKTTHANTTRVMIMDIDDQQGLVMAFNLKSYFTGANLYEKLLFIRQVIPFLPPQEIYQKTSLDITIDQRLTSKLDVLVTPGFQEILSQERITLKSALKLCDLAGEDRGALLGLFSRVPFSSSHQQQILEITEELLFREKCPLAEIFTRLDIHLYLENEKPQKTILDILSRFRHPVSNEAEEQWQKELASLDLPPHIRITHYPFFEKKELELTIRLTDIHGLKEIIKRYSSLS